LPLKSAQQQENEQLRRGLAKVKMERDILKKSAGLVREIADVKFAFVARRVRKTKSRRSKRFAYRSAYVHHGRAHASSAAL